MKKNYTFIALIDSLRLSIDSQYLENYMLINCLPFVSRNKINDKIDNGCLTKMMVINPNNFTGKYNPIHTMKNFEAIMEKIYVLSRIKDNSKVNLHRIDIALDSSITFEKNFKFLLFIFELVTINYDKSDKWYTTNLNTLKSNTIIMKTRSIEICFYNKAEESNSRHYANTRCEFRFLRVSDKNYEKHINKINKMLTNIEKSVTNLELLMSQRLIYLWQDEFIKGHIKSFSEFVRKYNVYFYTTNIVMAVYNATELKGSYKKWIDRFRETNNILELFTVSDVIYFRKAVNKSITNYLNS